MEMPRKRKLLMSKKKVFAKFNFYGKMYEHVLLFRLTKVQM